MIVMLNTLIAEIEEKFRENKDKYLIYELTGIAKVVRILEGEKWLKRYEANIILKKINKLMKFILRNSE